MHDAAAKTQQRRAPSTPAAAVSRGQGLCCLVLCVLRECVCVWCPTMSGTKGAGPLGAQNRTKSEVCLHWEACGDQRRNYWGPPTRFTFPVATPPHKSLYSFTRLEQQAFWEVKREQLFLADLPEMCLLMGTWGINNCLTEPHGLTSLGMKPFPVT